MSYDLDGIRRTSEDKVSRQKEQKYLQLDIRELVKILVSGEMKSEKMRQNLSKQHSCYH